MLFKVKTVYNKVDIILYYIYIDIRKYGGDKTPYNYTNIETDPY